MKLLFSQVLKTRSHFSMSAFLIGALLIGSQSVQAQSSQVNIDSQLKSKLHQEIDYIGSLYGTVYAPKGWKEVHLGWNLADEVAKAQAQLESAKNLFEARAAVGNLIKSTKDYHVSYSFYSTEKATLSFQVKTVEGKSLIVSIDRDKLSKAAFPFTTGDEVLSFNQVPVAQILTELVQAMGPNISETDYALADLYLTRRSGARNFAVPHGPVTLAIKRASDDSVGTVAVAWDYAPEQLNHGGTTFLKTGVNGLFNHKMVLPEAKELSVAGSPFGIGERNSFLKDFGTRVWSSPADSDFDAYIYVNEAGQSIGVVRIPVYEAPNDDYAKAVADFSIIIKKMQAETSAMIIDQNNNPGGSVFYLYSLASMLSDQTLKVPTHSVSLLPSEAKDCIKAIESLRDVKSDEDAQAVLGKDMQGFTATYQLVLGTRDYCQSTLNEFHQGKRLSSPLHLWGVDEINPNPVHYTKPIVLLTNMLDFSGGDFFPAIMQDNKRVTVVGTRTAGAGGYILQATFPNSFGLDNISFTGSIAERVDSNPIENLGITPNFVVPMTVADIRGEFHDYKAQVKAILADLLVK